MLLVQIPLLLLNTNVKCCLCSEYLKDHAGILLFPLELQESKLPFSEVSKHPLNMANSDITSRTNVLAKHKPESPSLPV